MQYISEKSEYEEKNFFFMHAYINITNENSRKMFIIIIIIPGVLLQCNITMK